MTEDLLDIRYSQHQRETSHLFCHLQQSLVVALPLGSPLRRLLLQLLDLLGHLQEDRQLPPQSEQQEAGQSPSSEGAPSYLLHLLSESGEDLIAFGQSALELLKLIHVEGELEDMKGNRSHCSPTHRNQHPVGLMSQTVNILLISTEQHLQKIY